MNGILLQHGYPIANNKDDENKRSDNKKNKIVLFNKVYS
jgi:hypothetical protein